MKTKHGEIGRVPCFVISPYAKPDHISKTGCSLISLIKFIQVFHELRPLHVRLKTKIPFAHKSLDKAHRISAGAHFVSCLMPTADRPPFVAQVIRCFLAQAYVDRELVIVDDGAYAVGDLVPDNERIRYFRREGKRFVGAKPNFACQQAHGDIIVHWDDDDWSAPWRMSYQVAQLREAGADIWGLNRVWFFAPEEQKAWGYIDPLRQQPWVYGASLCYTREFWQRHPFPEIRVGEDTGFVSTDTKARVHALANSRFLVARIHEKNTSRKRTSDSRYQPRALDEINELLGADAAAFLSPAACWNAGYQTHSHRRGRAWSEFDPQLN